MQLREQFADIYGCAGRFDPTVVVRGETSDTCLLLVVEQQHLIDDRHEMFGGHVLEGIGNRGADEVSMRGLAADDDAEGNQGIDLSVLHEKLSADRDFKCTRDPVERDGGIGDDPDELLVGRLDERVHVVLVVE